MITRLWRWLFCGCAHKWTVLERAPVYLRAADNIPVFTDFVLQCERCGNIKRKRT